MRKLFSTRVKVILVLAILLTAGLAILSSVTGQSLPGLLMQSIMAPIRSAANSLTNQAEQYYNYMFQYEALAAENEALREQIAKMEDDARQADSISRENARLRELLALKSVHEDYEMVDAYIISWSSNDWTNTFTINRGTDAGIYEDMVAITANGEVVGLVTEAGHNYAVVKTILDSTLEISATIVSSGSKGMVSGGYTSNHEDLLRMDYLPSSARIKNGDQVVTAGSTVYPRGLILGKIIDADFDDTGVAKFAMLIPAAEIDSMEQVFILTAYSTDAAQTTE